MPLALASSAKSRFQASKPPPELPHWAASAVAPNDASIAHATTAASARPLPFLMQISMPTIRRKLAPDRRWVLDRRCVVRYPSFRRRPARPCRFNQPEETRMTASFTRNAVVLGLLSAVGPFAIDMYLPALPSIAADLGASTAATQMTLTAFFIAFGLCQIAYGPLSDVYGRKPPLYAGLALFTLGSIGCAFAPNVGWLIACRFLQGTGAAAMGVIPRAIIRDLHTGVEATRLMALVMLVFSVSPILAPLSGSALIVPFGWRAVFVAVTVAAVIGLVLTISLLPETRPAAERIRGDLRSVLGSFAELLRDWHFLGLTFIGGLGMASFFAFLATSSFVYINHYGLSPTQYSMAFSVNAIGFIGASQFAASLGARFSMERMVRWAVG